MSLEKSQLLTGHTVRLSVDEHLAEDVAEHVDHDAVACESVLCGVAYARGLYLVDVGIIHVHQPEALTRCELPYPEFLALQLGRELYLLFLFHVVFSFQDYCQWVIVRLYCSPDVVQGWAHKAG